MATMLKRLVISLFVLLLLGAIALPASLLIWGLQDVPLVSEKNTLAYDDVERIKTFLHRNDPRKLREGDVKTVECLERDMNLFLHYGLSHTRIIRNVRAEVEIHDRRAEARLTVPLPAGLPGGLNRFGRFLNVAVHFSQAPSLVDIDRVSIGALSIPGFVPHLTIRVVHWLLAEVPAYKEIVQAVDSIHEMRLEEGLAAVTFQWNRDVMRKIKKQGRDLLLSSQERDRLLGYDRLVATISHRFEGKQLPLGEFLTPLFQQVGTRSLKSDDPQAENRAAILALATYATGRNLSKLIGDAGSTKIPSAHRMRLTLRNRHDLALHFLVSAAITVTANSGLANLAGVFKEVSDSKGGSGFSFADLAADRAGVRFAELATQSKHTAYTLMGGLVEKIDEDAFMPRIDHLPEGLMELQFKRSYKELGAAAYRQVEDEIGRRIRGCSLYQ